MATTVYDYTPAQAQMVDLYQIYRLAMINQRYYGCRAVEVGRWYSRLQIGSTVSSTMTIVGLLANFPFPALLVTAVASLAGAVALILELSGKKERFEKLSFAYAELSAQTDHLKRNIETERVVTEREIGRIEAMREVWSRLAALDEQKPNQRLVDLITEDVKKAFPVESFWLP